VQLSTDNVETTTDFVPSIAEVTANHLEMKVRNLTEILYSESDFGGIHSLTFQFGQENVSPAIGTYMYPESLIAMPVKQGQSIRELSFKLRKMPDQSLVLFAVEAFGAD